MLHGNSWRVILPGISRISTINPTFLNKSRFVGVDAWKRLGFDGKVLGDGSRTISENIKSWPELVRKPFQSDPRVTPKLPQSYLKVTSKSPDSDPRVTLDDY